MGAPDEVLNIAPDEGDKLRAKALAADAEELPAGYYTSPRVVCTFMSISLTLLSTYFAFEASAAAISFIIEDIGPSENVSLFSTVWTVSQSISILLMGRLTDRFGRRGFILGTNCVGIIGGIGCLYSFQRFNTMIGAQVLLGLAAGQPGACILFIGELMSNKTKFLGNVIVAFPNVIATGFGPYIGQSLGINGNWRWIFYIYIIITAVSTVLAFIFYHPPSFAQLHGKKISRRDELLKVDWIGAFFLTAGMTLFLLGVSWGGSPDPWDSPKILGLLISGIVSCVIFVLYECYAKIDRPIIPMEFFPGTFAGFGCMLLISGVMGSMNTALFIMYPQQVQHIFSSTLSSWQEVAWMSSTAGFGIWAGIVTLGSLFHIFRHIRWQLIFGSAWVTAFLGAMASVNRHKKSEAIAFSICTGFVIGWAEDVTMLLVQFISSDENLGVTFSVVSATRAICGSIFTAAFISLYTIKFPGQLQSKLVPAVPRRWGFPGVLLVAGFAYWRALTGQCPSYWLLFPGMTSNLIQVTNDAVADSYAAAYSYVYYFAMALGVIAIIASACTKDFDHYLTSHVPHQIYAAKDADVDLLDSDRSTENVSSAAVTVSEKE
uniref:Trichothecene efflux pump TRI12 n=1 Tax=Trichoderma arundinaceum TaxID=490622 RepID=TRI12_TRIAR|nr:RecName: Full=Trichothecene efflux pump TRI12; AltName: Full=Trichothecene biosynthesis protein 12 [Trichoderma arundinaceum]CAY87358.1 putative trichothecene efflux pump [Trichoderma arundinaceum]